MKIRFCNGPSGSSSLRSIFSFSITKAFSFGATRAAELAGIMTGKPMITIVNWRSYFLEISKIPETQSGKYIRQGVVWNNGHLIKKATQFIQCQRTA